MQPEDDALGMGAPIDRRDVLHGLAAGIGGAMLAGFGAPAASAAAGAQGEAGYYPPTRLGMRGSHPGSFENAHALRDGTLTPDHAEDSGERYDLIVVGGGISGLAAAHFLRAERPRARILILDNHDDFGGHAKRNEFHVAGRTLLLNGGTMLIDSPRPYSPVAAGLLADLGIDPVALATRFPANAAYRERKLGQAVFFDRETFGNDALIRMPSGRHEQVEAAALAASLSAAPLSAKAIADIVHVETGEVDPLPELDMAAKMDRLSRISYRDYLAEIMRVDPTVLTYYQNRTHGEWGIGIDAEPALDCWGIGLPGFKGLKLDPTHAARMGNTGAGYATTGGSASFHFPDGNATIARALVRALAPAVGEPGPIEGLVSTRFDYGQLDRAGQPVRIRLNSVVVHAAPAAEGVEVAYIVGGKLVRVAARACVLACYNMMIPYLVPALPDAQKAALHALVKVPLVYVSVALTNWRAFAALGVANVTCPGGYFSSFGLAPVLDIGGVPVPHRPDDPVLVHMTRTPCLPGAPTERDQHRAGRAELLATPFATFERNVRDQLGRALGQGGFDPARDIAGIAVNRWPHGYAYEYNPLYDPWDVAEEERPHVIGRRRFGAIAIANSDSGAAAYTDSAIDQAHRAVRELIDAAEVAL